ncbi:MAG: excinuclease ABC subunit UvrB [Erysipelotrichaceae bacterium]|nr:excinuclease ABC subunit UvrB [Erysipelotrichaceae bacterium]
MEKFVLESKYSPTGDQPEAIKSLVDGLKANKKIQVLLGATGTGKTFTIGNVIASINKPTLILVHNKTLAGQLYAEFKELFPHNRVEYFVSNFDFYQPEAYIASTDTYIDKTAQSNMDIEMMRVSAVSSILSRKDTIVVASVAAIYALSNPEEFRNLTYDFRVNESYNRKEVISALIEAQYTRNDIDLKPGCFSFKGDVLEIAPFLKSEEIVRIEFFADEIERIVVVDPLTKKSKKELSLFSLFPAYEHISSRKKISKACETIKEELFERVRYFNEQNKPLEAERITQRTLHDIEALQEFGICSGIENYSRHIDQRKEGQTPYCIFDYFPEDFLLVVDESHVSLPQIRGMYNGDRSRKETLVEYGFRLKSALDNRPLRFDEFEKKINQAIFVSATPGDYELEKVNYQVVEQVIRPTFLLDPLIEVHPSKNQIDDILNEIKKRIDKNERVLITTLTIRMAEDLTSYLKNVGLKVVYMHNEIKTLERTQILYELRKGKYDVLVGINLLREGIDLPEVSLICILDADKEGFLRSERSLIQIIGRAARNENGKVIMYADSMTDSMKKAIDETKRRRSIQQEYNEKNHIIPHTVIKEIKAPETLSKNVDLMKDYLSKDKKVAKKSTEELIASLTKEMKEAAKNLDFEQAATLRDIILELKSELSS